VVVVRVEVVEVLVDVVVVVVVRVYGHWSAGRLLAFIKLNLKRTSILSCTGEEPLSPVVPVQNLKIL
jgi:hypothetical protein